MGKTRAPAAPKIPTTDELNVPALHVTFWFGLWAPKGTPKPIVTRLSTAVAEALGDPTVRQRLTELGAEIPPRESDTSSLCRLPEGRSREMVAVYQIGGHQGGMICDVRFWPKADFGRKRESEGSCLQTRDQALYSSFRACDQATMPPPRNAIAKQTAPHSNVYS